MRPLKELIEEARAEAEKEKTDHAAIVVGFEIGTKYVWLHKPEPLATLTALVNSGGTPMGILLTVPFPTKASVEPTLRGRRKIKLRKFQEWNDAPEVDDYLQRLGCHLEQIELLAAHPPSIRFNRAEQN